LSWTRAAPGFFRFLFGIDEYQFQVGFVALIQRHEFANDFAYVAQTCILQGGVDGDVDRPCKLAEDSHTGGFQAVAGVEGDIPLHVMAGRQVAQPERDAEQQQDIQQIAQ